MRFFSRSVRLRTVPLLAMLVLALSHAMAHDQSTVERSTIDRSTMVELSTVDSSTLVPTLTDMKLKLFNTNKAKELEALEGQIREVQADLAAWEPRGPGAPEPAIDQQDLAEKLSALKRTAQALESELDFEVAQCWPSPCARRELSAIQQEYLTALNSIQDMYPALKELQPLDKDTRRERLQADPELNRQAIDSADQMSLADDARILSIARASIQLRGLSDEQKELVRSSIDSDFWQAQNLMVVEDAAESFSTANQGRRGRSAKAAENAAAEPSGVTRSAAAVDAAGEGAAPDAEAPTVVSPDT